MKLLKYAAAGLHSVRQWEEMLLVPTTDKARSRITQISSASTSLQLQEQTFVSYHINYINSQLEELLRTFQQNNQAGEDLYRAVPGSQSEQPLAPPTPLSK